MAFPFIAIGMLIIIGWCLTIAFWWTILLVIPMLFLATFVIVGLALDAKDEKDELRRLSGH